MKTPNCCANCVRCTRMPPPAVGHYLGGTKYHCSRFKKVVNPDDESCKVHERYVEGQARKGLIKNPGNGFWWHNFHGYGWEPVKVIDGRVKLLGCHGSSKIYPTDEFIGPIRVEEAPQWQDSIMRLIQQCAEDKVEDKAEDKEREMTDGNRTKSDCRS